MAEIRPFPAVHYDPSIVKDLADVICPPYDIISPGMREELYRRSQYNFVRVEYTKEEAGDSSDSKYSRAVAALEDWLGKGILKKDAKPAIYLHDQRFSLEGKAYRRQGMFVVVRLEEWSKMVVRPHENTMSAPKSDRLNLLWALQANTSPVFGLYEDHRQEITGLLETEAKRQPMLDFKMDGESHRVWAVTDSKVVKGICGALAGQPIYIADGHHRYESALNYRRERRACAAVTGDQPYDFVMMALVDFADPGLVILPTHRLLRGFPEATARGLAARLEEFFEIQSVPAQLSGLGGQLDQLWSSESHDHPGLVLFGPDKGKLLHLKVRDLAKASEIMPGQHSAIYRRLNVSIVEHILLEKLFGLTSENEISHLGYSHDRQEAVNRVTSGEYQMALLLSPVKPAALKAIADISDRMPRKSTYFYPKLPSGLVLHRMV